MPKADPIFPSFSRGEVSPLMYGRVDLQQYFVGLETAENCLVRPYGLLMNRPGSGFIAPVKDPTKKTRLLEFIFNEADAFIIEMGENYFRFFTLGGAVTEASDTITGITNANPGVVTTGAAHGYSNGDEVIISGVVGMTEVNGLRFRVNNVAATTYELQDLDGVDVDTTSFGAYVSGGVSDKIFEVAHTYTEDELFDIHYSQINDVVDLAAGGNVHAPAELIRLASNNWTLNDIDFKGGPVLDANDTATTITPSSGTGATTLTASSPIFQAGHVGSTWRVNGANYVRITSFTSTTVVDGVVQTGDDIGVGAVTDWAEGAWSTVRGFPATVTYHERRRWWARTDHQPQNQWASIPFVFDDYDIGTGADDDALNLQLNTELANDIKWLSSGTVLATGTFGGEFITSATGSGTNTVPLTPDNANATRQTGWGSRNIQPRKIANFVYYVQAFGRKIRELFYFFDLDNYKSEDKTILSEHITFSGITNMTYQQNPDSTLWCVREDGQMAMLVREVDQQVAGWSRAVTDGEYESVAAIPSNLGPYDEVWVVVKRTINGVTRRYIERFETPLVEEDTRQEDLNYVDSSLKFDAYNSTTGVTLTLSATSGLGITVTASAAFFNSGDIGQRIRAISNDGLKTVLGELTITQFNSDTEVLGDVASALPFSTTFYAAKEWAVSVNTISGFDHLEAKELSILADGAVIARETVASGSFTMEIDAFEAVAGLPYTATLQTLSIEAGATLGTAQGKKKRIYELGLRVFKTLGIEVGGDVDKTSLVQFRDPQTLMGTPEPLFSGVIPNIRFTGSWVYEAKVVIKQSRPYPMHILGIMPKLKLNEKT